MSERNLAERGTRVGGQVAQAERVERVTHGRHCTCSACAAEDWTDSRFVCGMHGADCPQRYQPWASAGTAVSGPEHTPQRDCKHGRLARSCTECEGERAMAKVERLDRIVADYERVGVHGALMGQRLLARLREALDSEDGVVHTPCMTSTTLNRNPNHEERS